MGFTRKYLIQKSRAGEEIFSQASILFLRMLAMILSCITLDLLAFLGLKLKTMPSKSCLMFLKGAFSLLTMSASVLTREGNLRGWGWRGMKVDLFLCVEVGNSIIYY